MPFVRSEAKIMEDIRNALAIADHPNTTEAEREAALSRANRLMAKHAIDQAVLDANRTIGEKRVPTSMRFDIWDDTFEWASYFQTILSEIARTNRCRVALHSGRKMSCTVVGMQEDVEWTQLLWMNIFFEFVSKINPKWDNQETMGANVLRLKEAGFKWEGIWRLYFHAVDGKTADGLSYYDPKKASYLMREYKKELKLTGREPVATVRFEAYRASFVAAFSNRIATRLESMRADSKEEEDSVPGSALALADLSGMIEEEYYRLFPTLRPLTDEQYAEMNKRAEEREAEEKRKDDEFLASLSAAERRRVLDEREKDKRRQARASDSYWREYDRRAQRLYDDAGFRAGRTAADSVNLSRSAGVGTEEKKELL